MAEDRSLTVKLAAQADGFARDLSQAMGSWDGFLKNIMGGKNTFLVAGGAIAGVAAAAFGLAKTAANAGDELFALSEKTGVSVERLSALKYAAEQSETNIGDLTTGLKFLGKSMVEASVDADSKAAVAFRALQIEFKNADGSLRPLNDILMDLADRLSDMHDPALKSTIAMELLGKAGVNLIPFLNQGSKGINTLTSAAETFGMIISTETAKAGDDFNDSLKTLVSSLTALAVQAGTPLLKPFTDLFNLLSAIGVPLIKGLSAVLNSALAGAYGLATAFSAVWYASAKLTDALGITKDMAQTAMDWMMKFSKQNEESTAAANKAFISIVSGSDKVDKTTKDLIKTKKEDVKITDAQVQKSLESADAKKKENAEAEKLAKAFIKKLKEEKKAFADMVEAAEELIDKTDENTESTKKYILRLDPLKDALERLHEEQNYGTEGMKRYKTNLDSTGAAAYGLEKALKELHGEVDITSDSMKRYVINVNPAAVAMNELSDELDIAQTMSYALGSEFDLTGAKTDLIRGKIEELVKLGVDPASEQIQALKGQLQSLRIDGAFHVQEFTDFTIDEFLKVKTAIEDNLSGALADAIMGGDVDWEALWKEGVLKMVLEDMIKYLIQMAIAATGVKTAMQGIFGVDVAAGAGAGAAGGAAGGAAASSGAGAAGGAGLLSILAGIAGGYVTYEGFKEDPLGSALSFPYAVTLGTIKAAEDVLGNVGDTISDAWEDTKDFFGFAHGGVVTGPTLGMIGEAGPEAVIPLSRLSTALGGSGGNVTLNLSLPGVRDIRDLTTRDFEQMAKRMMLAVENLDRRGWRWPMQPREA